ncbi:MAG: transcription antitermination factor NusB [Bacteroidales bacterium]|nr:transcription antitermination factor NusB [Bacteroidales bacterium]
MISRRILRIKTLQVLYAFYKSPDSGINKAEKELFHSINKAYELYHYLILLLLEIVDYANSRLEIARQKNIPSAEDLNPNTRFVDNKVIQQFRISTELNGFLHNTKLSWVNHPELIKKLYNNIRQSDYYITYMSNSGDSYEDDKEVLYKICSEEIAKSEDLYAILEEQSIYWNDEFEFILGIIIKSIKGFKEKDRENIRLFPLFKNEDDVDFVKRLFRKTILHKDEYLELIKQFTQNWEIERIAFMDILILQMAITEIIEFKSIPTKVSFNEYLEIAKFYSTNKSSVFINGVLDKIIKHLKDTEKIQKQGRGLVGE